LCVVIM